MLLSTVLLLYALMTTAYPHHYSSSGNLISIKRSSSPLTFLWLKGTVFCENIGIAQFLRLRNKPTTLPVRCLPSCNGPGPVDLSHRAIPLRLAAYFAVDISCLRFLRKIVSNQANIVRLVKGLQLFGNHVQRSQANYSLQANTEYKGGISLKSTMALHSQP